MPVRVGIPTDISGLIDDLESPVYAASVGLLKFAVSQDEDVQSGGGFSVPGLNKLP